MIVCVIVDINKFLWMVRIGGSTEKGQHIKEEDYFTPQGEFRVDREGSQVLLNCLMYKMCYYRFGQVYTEQGEVYRVLVDCVSMIEDVWCSPGKPSGYDRVRNAEIGNKVSWLDRVQVIGCDCVCVITGV